MREGWTYKKLGEVCNIYQPKTISTEQLVEDGDYLVYGANGIIGRYDKYNHEESEVLMTCRGATCGTINVSEPFSWINGNAMVVHPLNDLVEKSYLSFCLRGTKLSDVITGAAQPQITRQKLSPKIIPVPPLSIQHSIVSELDMLSGLIAKHEEQLKAYDELAQSIFFDMFGDPVENEKGWEVKKLGEVGVFQRGSGIQRKDFIKEGYPCIHYGQLHTTFGAFTKKHISCISKELFDVSRIAHKGDLILALTSGDVVGSCKSTPLLRDYDIAVGSDAAIYSHSQNAIYLSYYTMTKAFYYEKQKYANGFKVTHISTKEIALIPVPLPPLSLQTLFAEKIEAIERQKERIRQSMAEVKTLFDSRMDYYFN